MDVLLAVAFVISFGAENQTEFVSKEEEALSQPVTASTPPRPQNACSPPLTPSAFAVDKSSSVNVPFPTPPQSDSSSPTRPSSPDVAPIATLPNTTSPLGNTASSSGNNALSSGSNTKTTASKDENVNKKENGNKKVKNWLDHERPPAIPVLDGKHLGCLFRKHQA
jgi:hypothetical protein